MAPPVLLHVGALWSPTTCQDPGTPRRGGTPCPNSHSSLDGCTAPSPLGLRSAVNTPPFSPSLFASLVFTLSSIFSFPLPPPTSPLPLALPPALSPPGGSASPRPRLTAASNQKGSKAGNEVSRPPRQGAEEEGHGRRTRDSSGNAVSLQAQ